MPSRWKVLFLPLSMVVGITYGFMELALIEGIMKGNISLRWDTYHLLMQILFFVVFLSLVIAHDKAVYVYTPILAAGLTLTTLVIEEITYLSIAPGLGVHPPWYAKSEVLFDWMPTWILQYTALITIIFLLLRLKSLSRKILPRDEA